MKERHEGVRKLWNKYKYAILVVLIGVGLLLWPSGTGGTERFSSQQATERGTRDLETELADMLGTISGVGQARVLLTLDSDGERLLAQDTELSYRGESAAPEDYSRRSETVLVDGGSGDAVVVTRTVYPTYRGALVVCQGGDRADVRLAVTEAVAALTGLSTDRVTVEKCQ